METDNTPKSASLPSGVPRRWQWRWFAVGFAVVFVGILFLYSVTTMHPSGQYAVDQRLAAYYADAISRFFRPRILGPATSSSNAFVRIAIEHLVLSAVGGLLTAGIGWWWRRRELRKA